VTQGPYSQREGAVVDVVIVSYNSGGFLRGAVASALEMPGANVIVVDNASPDDSVSAVADLPVHTIPLTENRGFAYGCNRGWQAGNAPHVLFLNPDARISPGGLQTLIDVLEDDPGIGIAAPLIRNEEGSLDLSLRRFPRVRSTYAQVLFFQRLFPRAAWSDEVVHDSRAYEERRSAEWLSGACILIRRELLERLGGFDEQFFLYCEDIDLCKRVHDLGFDVVFEPEAVAVHAGGKSGSRPALYPTLAESRIRYAKKHRSRPDQFLERLGIALVALTHMVVTQGGIDPRAGHARSLKAVVGGTVSRP
jgi:GT2 family glycosyltransferase